MKTEHTEGPWKAVYAAPALPGSGWTIWSTVPGEGRIGTLMHREQEEANARLIAAAPELLQTLGEIGDVLDQWATKQEPTLEEIAEMRGVVESAIAKAEGKL